MPRLLQVVHGYPPRENAGTEQYAHRLATGLRRRGWEVHTFAPTLAPGRPMWERMEAPGVTRYVQNAPWAALRLGPADPAVDRLYAEVQDRFRPDVVHLHHLHGVSSTLPLGAPAVWTLHDAWAWCAAGGQLVHDGAPCDGPGPACAACASAWARDTPRVTAGLRLAAAAGRFLPADRLHAAWRRLPARLRARATAGRAPPVDPSLPEARRRAFLDLARRCRLVSPSRYFAAAAVRAGFPPPVVLPHGVDPTPRLPLADDAPFVFLGTLAPHKGPHLVRAAWERAGRPAPLRIHGPAGPDAAYVAALRDDGPVPAGAVPALLAGARALVLGSTWPENAPLVVLEARAAGCPVVAPALGGIPELLTPGVDGWLYPPGEVDALAACLRAAMRAPPPVSPPPSFQEHLDRLLALYAGA